MTSKISLFNKGIYKSTVRRYVWGSVLYFILLFMMTGMAILLTVDKTRVITSYSASNIPLILREDYIMFPVAAAFFVPTVVALLTFRFVHSKKTSVFVHSLPVSRTANYVSTLIAAFTLMAVPVILNGTILMLISISGYSTFFGIASCFIWMGINLLALFMMFSVSCFAAMLTGNSFAMIAINVILHFFVPLITTGFSSVASWFLYGYHNTNEVTLKVMEWNFTQYIILLAEEKGTPGDIGKLVIMIAASILFYVLAWILYKKRRIETVEDVAAFKCLNPIFKYSLTFIASLGTLALFGSFAGKKNFLLCFIIVLVSIIVYFGAEMILKKTLKVWQAYKGYIVFAVLFACMSCMFVFTSFFGYETRVPDMDEVESVAVYEYYYQEDEPYVDDEYIIAYATGVHQSLTADDKIYTVNPDTEPNYNTAMHFKYKLKNGSTMTRRYRVTDEKAFQILVGLYRSEQYKQKTIELFDDNIYELYRMSLNNGQEYIYDKEKVSELYECLKKDTLALDYSRTGDRGQAWEKYIVIEYDRKSEQNIFDENVRGLYSIHLNINANYTNTINWLKENGYGDKLFNSDNKDLCVLTAEQWNIYAQESKSVEYYDSPTVSVSELHTFEDIDGAVLYEDNATKQKIAEFVTSHGVRYLPWEEYSYYVCQVTEEGYLEIAAAFYEEDGAELISILSE